MAKSLADQLAIVGNPILDDDLISYIIGGLSPTYYAFVMIFSMLTMDASMTLMSTKCCTFNPLNSHMLIPLHFYLFDFVLF